MIKSYFEFTDEMLERIEKFYDMHINATLNLTAIKDKDSFYTKHVLDSFLLFTEKKHLLKGKIGDIGTGGGFPGVILAVMYPELNFTLVDSVAKKCRFLEDAVKELGLTNVEVITSRSEDIKNRKFSTILSRGVAKVEQMIKYTMNLADKDCVWVLYKGENVKDELAAAQSILEKKRLEFINVRYDTPIQRTYTILSSSADNDRLR
ncbi:methyltransferase GidB [Denitrovibrio acetiphilus DSM 12809]|uniref:Ribosomal RNA small subunit methyltransferase G n=1 Tax=Denitrovibrio acetiphilus (strain DSM 12809 / NBRC 114555 / N2460) TaxID=522772 RepID=D4H6F2_DENA2|nr:16S rRNA (guanine(527)-N(7))-methyltransferase RsmG [Denitrovibrio acetiphilus]ADD69626.1 methyltransferase GidB [Denitrovibrio acetiphilus DSM 12809]